MILRRNQAFDNSYKDTVFISVTFVADIGDYIFVVYIQSTQAACPG